MKNLKPGEVSNMMDVSVIGAFLAGLLSFLSPCILPIVPFYLSYLAGVSIHEVANSEEPSPKVQRNAIIATCCFSLGIITVFVALGASATMLGSVFRDYFDILRWVAGAIIILMGLHFLGVIKLKILYNQLSSSQGSTNISGPFGAYVIGLAFAFGWTPCVGPVLATILFTAGGQETAADGALLLFIYAVGMTSPFILSAVFIKSFMKWTKGFRRHLPIIEKAMGVLLIIFGILIATNSVNIIAQWMLETMPFFNSVLA